MAIDSGTKATGTEFSSEIPVELLGESGKLAAGAGPYQLAWRRLRRNRAALAFGGLFLLILVLCLLAPVYAHDIAHTGPNDNHITETIKVGGKATDVVNAIGLPIGPTWHSRFFLGADTNGRDVAVRLLYGLSLYTTYLLSPWLRSLLDMATQRVSASSRRSAAAVSGNSGHLPRSRPMGSATAALTPSARVRLWAVTSRYR